MLILALTLASVIFFNFPECVAVLEVVVGDVFGYGGVSQSLHHGVLDHLVRVGGLAHALVGLSCSVLQRPLGGPGTAGRFLLSAVSCIGSF